MLAYRTPTKPPKPCACSACRQPGADAVRCLACGRGHLRAVEMKQGSVTWICHVCKRINEISERGHIVRD